VRRVHYHPSRRIEKEESTRKVDVFVMFIYDDFREGVILSQQILYAFGIPRLYIIKPSIKFSKT